MKRNKTYLIGRVFGKLKVTGFSRVQKNKDGTNTSLWKCTCECGNKTILPATSLLGKTRSCGCVRKCSSGYSETKTYFTYQSILGRCYYKKNESYKWYGGRGIQVCERWRKSFNNFLEDMGPKPEGLSLDRIDNNGDYCKENCRWATIKQQARNTSTNIVIEAFGKRQTVADWSEELGMARHVIYTRIKSGWPVEDSLTKKIDRKERLITCFGKTLNLSSWSKETGISTITIRLRLKRGWAIEEALTLKSDWRKKEDKINRNSSDRKKETHLSDI